MGDEAEASGALLAGRGRRELKQRKFEGVAVTCAKIARLNKSCTKRKNWLFFTIDKSKVGQ